MIIFDFVTLNYLCSKTSFRFSTPIHVFTKGLYGVPSVENTALYLCVLAAFSVSLSGTV